MTLPTIEELAIASCKKNGECGTLSADKKFVCTLKRNHPGNHKGESVHKIIPFG